MPRADESFLQPFYQHLADGPLEPDHPWYVPIYAGPAAATVDPVQRLARGMKWSPLESVQLFSGFRGTGKSTELRRLRRVLEAQGYKVVLCDMKQYLNLSTPIDISDFLISMAGALSDALAEDPELVGKDLVTRGYWQRVVDFLTRENVQLDGIDLGNIKVGLKQDPGFREILQDRMKGHLGGLANDVREFMADCVKAVRRKHGDETHLAVLFDSIEQIRGSSINDAEVFRSVETLFAGHPDKLHFQSMHIVYTVPPWLKIRSPGVTKLYNGGYLLPCVKVRQREGEPFNEGLDVLAEIVAKRGDWRQLFASVEDFHHVLLATGGYLRDLFRAIQGVLMSAADHGELPLGREAIEWELAQLRNEYLPISYADAHWLWRVARTHEAELPAHAGIPELARYFEYHLLLCYRNGEEWYDLHPLIRETVQRLVERSRDAEPEQ